MINPVQQRYPTFTEFNPFEPSQASDPYPIYAQAREAAPIFFSPLLNMWVVTRHEDICEIARDTDRFSNSRAVNAVGEIPAEVLAIFATSDVQPEFLVEIDPPAHARVRRLSNKGFTPQRVAALEPQIRELTNELVDAFVQDGKADLMAQFADLLPRMVICTAVGVPRADITKFGQWTDDWANFLFTVGLPLERQLAGARGAVALQEYSKALIEQRRQHPEDDLLTDLVQAQEDNGRLSMNELVGLIMSFLIAGTVTSSDLIGNALVLLLRQPELWQTVCEKPELASRVVEETLRRDTSIPGLMRVAMEDITFKGVAITKGDRLMLAFASANHDETVFQDPRRFDIERENVQKHLAFGQGIHYCIGAPIARLEGKVALEVLSQRLPNLRFQPDIPVTFRPSLVYHGPEQLHLMWDVPV